MKTNSTDNNKKNLFSGSNELSTYSKATALFRNYREGGEKGVARRKITFVVAVEDFP